MKSGVSIACQNGHLEIVMFLVEKGANMDKATDNGATCLYYACVYDQLEIVMFLLEKGILMCTIYEFVRVIHEVRTLKLFWVLKTTFFFGGKEPNFFL